jgi:hypothetical protein
MVDSVYTEQMKAFIHIVSEYGVLVESEGQYSDPQILTESVSNNPNNPFLAECRDIIFKLRSFMESESEGDHALGVEEGMARAADMLENLVARYEKGDNFGS